MSILLDILFPISCYGCGQKGEYLCSACRLKLIYRGIKYSPADSFEGRISLFRYSGAIKKIISDLKFSYVTDLMPTLANLLIYGLVNKYPHILNYWQQNNFVLVPIPLHNYRFNWRGFNQSELICQKLASELNLTVSSNLLTRTQNTIPQASIRDRRLRRLNTQSSFLVNQDSLNSVKFSNYILVDDVYTTGSTIRSAISALPANSHIWVLTVAG